MRITSMRAMLQTFLEIRRSLTPVAPANHPKLQVVIDKMFVAPSRIPEKHEICIEPSLNVNEIFLHNEIFSATPVHVIEAQHIVEIIVYIHVIAAQHLADINLVAVRLVVHVHVIAVLYLLAVHLFHLQFVAAHLFRLQIVVALHLGAEVIHNFGRFVRAQVIFKTITW